MAELGHGTGSPLRPPPSMARIQVCSTCLDPGMCHVVMWTDGVSWVLGNRVQGRQELRSSVKVRHNENQETQRNRLAGSRQCRQSTGCGPPPTLHRLAGRLRGWHTGQGTRGVCGVRAAMARTLTLRPWVRTDGAPVRARPWPSQPRLNPQQTFSCRQSVDPSYERWNVRNVIMFLINR